MQEKLIVKDAKIKMIKSLIQNLKVDFENLTKDKKFEDFEPYEKRDIYSKLDIVSEILFIIKDI